jgi:geranylgeranyl pyrophosphate synthase
MNAAALEKRNVDALDVEAICVLISNRLEQVTIDAPQALRCMSADHLATKGKKLRGRLAFQSALTFGAEFDKAVDWAAAVELIHNASLIHDDLCDRDAERRGKETICNQYGEAIAVCLGDYYIAAGFRLAALVGPQTIPVFSDSVITSIGGQASEFVVPGYPSWSQYRDIAVRKTSPLLSLSVIGAAAITGYSVNHSSVERYFSHAATCFQIINDLHNFTIAIGSDSPCSDLVNGRPNAVVACFRDALAAPMQAVFDSWIDRIRAGELMIDMAETQEWWRRVQQSEAFVHTVQQLHFHFTAAANEMLRLPLEIQIVLKDFQKWLASELSDVNQCALIEKGMEL